MVRHFEILRKKTRKIREIDFLIVLISRFVFPKQNFKFEIKFHLKYDIDIVIKFMTCQYFIEFHILDYESVLEQL